MTEPFGHSDVITGHVDRDDLATSVRQLDRPISRITLSSLGDSENAQPVGRNKRSALRRTGAKAVSAGGDFGERV